MKTLLTEWNKYIITEKLDYETLVITKKIMSEFKSLMAYHYKNPANKNLIRIIDKNKFDLIKNKLPKNFSSIILEIIFADYEEPKFAGEAHRGKDDCRIKLITILPLKYKNVSSSSLNELLKDFGVDLAGGIKSTIRHELEHIHQEMEKTFNVVIHGHSKIFEYFYDKNEMEAQIVGLHRLAKHYRNSIDMAFDKFSDQLWDKLIEERENADEDASYRYTPEEEYYLIIDKYKKYSKHRYPKAWASTN